MIFILNDFFSCSLSNSQTRLCQKRRLPRVSSKDKSRINDFNHRETDIGSVEIRNFQWSELIKKKKKKASSVDNPEIVRFSSEAGKHGLETFIHPLIHSLTSLLKMYWASTTCSICIWYNRGSCGESYKRSRSLV